MTIVYLRNEWRTITEVKNYFNDTFGYYVFLDGSGDAINLPDRIYDILYNRIIGYIIFVVQNGRFEEDWI